MKSRIVYSIALVSALLSACGGSNQTKNANAQKGADMAKLLAMQAQITDSLPPLTGIEQRNVTIRYISKGNSVASRPIRLYIPESSARPMHRGKLENLILNPSL